MSHQTQICAVFILSALLEYDQTNPDAVDLSNLLSISPSLSLIHSFFFSPSVYSPSIKSLSLLEQALKLWSRLLSTCGMNV